MELLNAKLTPKSEKLRAAQIEQPAARNALADLAAKLCPDFQKSLLPVTPFDIVVELHAAPVDLGDQIWVELLDGGE